MTGLHDLWLFSLTVLVLNATPGVDMMLTASRTLQHGLRSGLATALGVSAGCVVHTLAAAFGLAALLAASAAAFAALKWVGAAYLAWLAIGLLRSAARPSLAADPTRQAPGAAPSGLLLFRQGLLTNVLNPKIALFFLALLPQFIAADTPHKTAAFLLLGAIMVAQGMAFLALFVAALAWLRRRQAARRDPQRPPSGRAGWRRGLEAAGGLALLALATRLVLTEQPP